MRAIGAMLAVAVAIPVVAATAQNGAPRITKQGAGKVRVGARHDKLRDRGLVGRKVPGCELRGPGQRAARLRAPLRGSVDLTRGNPRRVRTILITGGDAQAKGVRVGSTRRAVRRAFPGAERDRSTEPVFGLTLFTAGRRLQFAVDTGTREVVGIGVPRIPFCE